MKNISFPSTFSLTYHFYFQVIDINDKPPKFNESVYKTSVSDDYVSGFLSVLAKDPDAGSSITYAIVSGSVESHVEGGNQIDWEKAFTIDGRTGALTFSAKIDNSLRGYVSLKIRASDTSKVLKLGAVQVLYVNLFFKKNDLCAKC